MKEKSGRVPALDGVRGGAILMVVAGHTVGSRLPYAASVGVLVFFVLSGFLITRILLAERATTQRIDFRAFYVRRLIRLYPALLLLLVLLPLLLWALSDDYLHGYLQHAAIAGLYLTDFANSSGHDLNDLGHTWSLAVEEQFYLVWPALLLALVTLTSRPRSRITLPRSISVVLAVAVAWRLVAMLMFSPGRIYSGPDTNFFALAAGCALAASPRTTTRLARLSWGGVVVLAACCLLQDPGHQGGSENVKNWLALAAVAGATALVARAARGAAWLEWRTLRWFGTISYSLYLWHWVLLNLGQGASVPTGLARGAADVAAVLVAALSYYGLERPLLRWKRRYERAGVEQVAPPHPTSAVTG